MAKIMVLLTGKIVVKCPRSGEEVAVDKKCVECDDYKHLGLKGAKVLVSCKYRRIPATKKKCRG